jgi:hypothetical protein
MEMYDYTHIYVYIQVLFLFNYTHIYVRTLGTNKLDDAWNCD